MRRDFKRPVGGPVPDAGRFRSRFHRSRAGGVRRVLLAAACALVGLLAATGSASASLALQGTFDGSSTPARSMTATWLAVSDRSGDVYVIDSAHDVVNIFSADGTYISQLTAPGVGTFGFGSTDDDIAIDNSGGPNDGNVYISSEGGGQAFAFDSTGRFLWQSSAGVSDICGISVDPSGNPWIGDFSNGVEELNAADGSLAGTTIAQTGDSCHHDWDSNGNLVLNHYDLYVDKYDSTGTFLFHYLPGDSSSDVAVDRSNNDVYAATTVGGNAVRHWDAAGDTTDTFATGANAVTVNSSDSTVYVSQGSHIAIYAPAQHMITATKSGTGSGSVTSAPSGIDCGATCSAPFDTGSTVTIAANPDSGSSFSGWNVTGDPTTTCTGTTSPCQVTMNADVTVDAQFDLLPRHHLTVREDGTGSGTVTGTDGVTQVIDCGGTCDALLSEGTIGSLTATPAPHSSFAGWSVTGDPSTSCTGATTPCNVTIGSGDVVATATFNQDPPTATTGSASGVTQTGATLGGTVNASGAATTCTFEYGPTAAYGSSVPCAADPGSGTSDTAVSATVSGLSAGTAYHFRVVARNAGGTTAGGDQTFTTASATPPPPPPPPTCATNSSLCKPGVLHLGTATVTVSKKGTMVLALSCRGDKACHETLKVVVKVKVRKHRRTVTETVVVAKASVKVAAGSKKSITVRLTTAARKLLAQRHQLRASLTAGALRHTLVIKEPPRPKPHRKG